MNFLVSSQTCGHNFNYKTESTDSHFQQQINRKYFTGAGLGCGGGPSTGKAALTTAQELRAGKNLSVVRLKNEKLGIIRKSFLVLLLVIMYSTIKYMDFNKFPCTGIYQEMRALEGGEPAGPMDMTAEEEELLYGSEDDTPPTEEEAEKARKQAEKEAEEADMNAKQAELQERIRRRKAERKQRIEEQRKLEQAAMLAEQERLRDEAEAEKAAHRRQIEKLEEQLRLARSGSGQKGEGGDGEEGEDELDDDRPNYQKRD
jgi:hypothetical protein